MNGTFGDLKPALSGRAPPKNRAESFNSMRNLGDPPSFGHDSFERDLESHRPLDKKHRSKYDLLNPLKPLEFHRLISQDPLDDE